MKKSMVIGLMLTAFAISPVWAESAQQSRMKTCNADAKTQSLAGDARKAFMKNCLSGAVENAKSTDHKLAEAAKTADAVPASPTGMTKSGKPMTAQQQRMKDCNAEAKSSELKGDPRKAFMKACLSNKKTG